MNNTFFLKKILTVEYIGFVLKTYRFNLYSLFIQH